MTGCQFPTPARHFFCNKHYRQMPTGLFFDFNKAQKERNPEKLEIVIQGIVKEMEAAKNETLSEKKGLFE